MLSVTFLIASLFFAGSALAAPIGSRAINNTLCAETFQETTKSILRACAAVNLADAQLAAIGQATCASATSVVLASLSPDCLAAGSVAGSAQASSNSSACVAAFTAFVGVNSSTITAATVPAALKAVNAACPAPAPTKTAEATLDDAQVTGNTLVELNNAAGSLAESLKNATALMPSLENCQTSIGLADSSTFAGCEILFVPPALNGQVIQACTAAAAAQLSIAEAGCGSLADAQKTHADAVLAGVQQGSNVTCDTASSNARLIFHQSCEGINNTLVNNATCQAGQATALGILSAPCISNQTTPA